MSMNWLGTAAILGLVGGAAVAGSPATASVEESMPTRLEVDLSERQMYLYHDGDLVKTYEVAIGEAEHPTPTGAFEIDRVEWNPDWVPPNTGWAKDKERKAPDDPDNPMVGAKLFFEYPDYYIHGTDARHTLGTAASHGCVRMDPAEVKDLAEWVQEHAGTDRSASWYERARQDDSSTEVMQLDDSVPVVIRD